MFMRRMFPIASIATIGLLVALPLAGATRSAKQQVWDTERDFARTMAERDVKAFGGFVSEEAVFFSGTGVLRGRNEIVGAWAKYFDGNEAPFSWEPDQVEVLESGTLALSTGPVRDPHGDVIARFNSIWRLEAPGRWRIVFDKGGPPSPGPAGPD
jgi:ketosteroid isomerase-like protein